MMTTTGTTTTTVARSFALLIPFGVIVHRLLGAEADRLFQRVIRPCLERQDLHCLNIWAVNTNEETEAMLHLEVDWDLHLSASQYVQVEGVWVKQGSPDLRYLVNEFEQLVRERGLKIRGSIALTAEADRQHLERLGLPRWHQRPWTRQPLQAEDTNPSGLDELRLQFNVA